MGKIIGIDLGTTNSCVAVVEGGTPQVIPNREGSRTTPSIVGFTRGRRAPRRPDRQAPGDHEPENTVYAVKRLIGRKFDADEVAARPRGPARTQIVAAAERRRQDPASRDRDYSPEEISAFVLREMKEFAEDCLGEAVDGGDHHGPGLLQRRPAPGHEGRRPHRRARGPAHHQRADRRGARLRPREPQGQRDRRGLRPRRRHVRHLDPRARRRASSRCASTAGDTFLGGEDFDKRIIDWLLDGLPARRPGSTCARTAWPCSASRKPPRRPSASSRPRSETEINLPFISADASGPEAHQHAS